MCVAHKCCYGRPYSAPSASWRLWWRRAIPVFQDGGAASSASLTSRASWMCAPHREPAWEGQFRQRRGSSPARRRCQSGGPSTGSVSCVPTI
eukprot:5606525-Prymnesium_polylepis.1